MVDGYNMDESLELSQCLVLYQVLQYQVQLTATLWLSGVVVDHHRVNVLINGLNFHRWSQPRNYFNSEIFPIYILKKHLNMNVYITENMFRTACGEWIPGVEDQAVLARGSRLTFLKVFRLTSIKSHTINFHMQSSIEERHSTVMLLYQVE